MCVGLTVENNKSTDGVGTIAAFAILTSCPSALIPSSETQGQIVGRTGNWGERKTTAEGEGAGRKELFSFPLLSPRPLPLRCFPLAPVSHPPLGLMHQFKHSAECVSADFLWALVNGVWAYFSFGHF